MSLSIGSDTDTPFPGPYSFSPVIKEPMLWGMESWDEWEAEIQERLAELTDEHSSPKHVRERRWVSIGSAVVRTTEGVTRFRAFLSRVKREWILHGPRI